MNYKLNGESESDKPGKDSWNMSKNKADEAAINSLPEEVLLRVFSFVGLEELKNLSLVNKKWKEMIGQSTNLMKKWPLVLDLGNQSWQEVFKVTSDFTNKYNTVVIKNCIRWNKFTLKVLRKHADLKVLNIDECEINEKREAKVLNELLSSMPKIEMLNCNNFEIEENANKALKPHDLPKLKSVILIDCRIALSNVIETAQLTKLMLSGCELHDEFFEYLAGQKCLEMLVAADLFAPQINIELLKSLQFPLKRLALNETVELLETEENTTAFLGNFCNTLEELELGEQVHSCAHEMVFSRFRKLKTLILDIGDAPTENVFYHNLRPNPSVRNLVVHGYRPNNLTALQGFIGNLPNIETLVLNTEHVTRELMLFISANLLNLKNLQLQQSSPGIYNNVTIASLTSIHFDEVSQESVKINDWKKMIEAFPNVESFSVKKTEYLSMTSLVFNIFTKGWTHLKHVKIGEGFVAEKRVFNQLLRNCHELESVEIIDDAFDYPRSKKDAILRDFKRSGLRVIIRDDLGAMDFNEGYGLLPTEKHLIDEFDSDDEDLFNMILGGGIIGFDQESDDDNQYIYFDSDGEMRDWFEEPDEDFFF